MSVIIVNEARFNGKDAGTVHEADKADAEKWTAMGLARKATKKEIEAASAAGESPKGDGEDGEKGLDGGPPADKAKKEADKKK